MTRVLSTQGWSGGKKQEQVESQVEGDLELEIKTESTEAGNLAWQVQPLETMHRHFGISVSVGVGASTLASTCRAREVGGGQRSTSDTSLAVSICKTWPRAERTGRMVLGRA